MEVVGRTEQHVELQLIVDLDRRACHGAQEPQLHEDEDDGQRHAAQVDTIVRHLPCVRFEMASGVRMEILLGRTSRQVDGNVDLQLDKPLRSSRRGLVQYDPHADGAAIGLCQRIGVAQRRSADESTDFDDLPLQVLLQRRAAQSWRNSRRGTSWPAPRNRRPP